MLFNTWTFVVSFLFVYVIYLQLDRSAQNTLLLFVSYGFYAYWDYRFLGLLIVSTLVDYGCGRGIAGARSTTHGRSLLALSATVNLGLLGVFKYYDFFVENAVRVLSTFGLHYAPDQLSVVLPLGISFYTFQTLGYTVDVYRRKVTPTRNLRDFALFVSFFPQLVAGPIERASRLLGQIQGRRILTSQALRSGVESLILGYFLKVVVADNAARIADDIFARSTSDLSPSVVALGVYAFLLQIYGDFGGYSSIARGLASLMGFQLVENFRQPYLATNPSDFWTRWHISLSGWLRDYLYIPLGGNRKGPARTYRNLGLTMILGGLWHGAAWNFVLWGAYHGALLVAFRLGGPLLERLGAARLPRPVKALAYLQLTAYGWLLFRANSLAHVGGLTSALLGLGDATARVGVDFDQLAAIAALGLVVLLLDLGFEHGSLRAAPSEAAGPASGRGATFAPSSVYVALLLLIVCFAARGGQDFIYFQF